MQKRRKCDCETYFVNQIYKRTAPEYHRSRFIDIIPCLLQVILGRSLFPCKNSINLLQIFNLIFFLQHIQNPD